ncbi:hypothetical protein COY95_02415, partial [Candidatus Woesearchaeota archaeon CG_4_10_14_0_8_um_filter_47_5]
MALTLSNVSMSGMQILGNTENIPYVQLGNVVFQQPLYLLLFIPLFILLVIIIRRDFLKDHAVYKRNRKRRFFVFVMRTVVLILLVLALASPATQHVEQTEGLLTLAVLVDNSTSMRVLDSNQYQNLITKLKESDVPLTVHYISSGDTTSLGDAILKQVEPDQNMLLISDGQNNAGSNLEDVSVFVSGLNSSINAVKLLEVEDDVGVSVSGPTKVVSDVEQTFEVSATKVGSFPTRPRLEITLDDEKIYDDVYTETVRLPLTFKEGTHVLHARVIPGGRDLFPENNEYYHIIKVIPRPRVLFVSKKSSP